MSKRKQLNEGLVGDLLQSAGKAAFNSLKPIAKDKLGKMGKKAFRSVAKAGIKKFGKGAMKSVMKTGKAIANNPEVRKAAGKLGKKAIEKVSSKLRMPVPQEALVERFSEIVEKSLCNEAWGLGIKAALTGAKGVAKGAAKTLGKQGIRGLKNMNKSKLASNIGKAIVDDVKQVASDAYDASPVGTIHNTFKDENGNWGFNPIRGIKKGIKGAIKTADNVFTGGLGQMAYDSISGESEEVKKSVKKVKNRRKK